MVTPRTIGRCVPAVMLAVAGTAVGIIPAHTAHATSSLQTLVTAAEHNTNTVRTLVHHDKFSSTGPGGSVTVSAHGTEDEVRNREQDYESVHVTRRATNGKVSKLNYSVDPYVVRQDLARHLTKGGTGSDSTQVTFGPFDSPVNIQPPAQASA